MKSQRFNAEDLRRSALAAMLESFPKKEVDESALTVNELAAASNRSRRMMHEHVARMVKSGKWEQVWKMGSIRLVPAYRKVKQLIPFRYALQFGKNHRTLALCDGKNYINLKMDIAEARKLGKSLVSGASN